MRKYFLIVGICVCMVLCLSLTGCKSNKKEVTSREILNPTDQVTYEEANSEEGDYSDEIKIVMSYNGTTVSKKAAEQIVEFSHKNGIGTIQRVDTCGVKDYYENEKTNNVLWIIFVYTEDEFFMAYVSSDNGMLYAITYNKDLYRYKANNSFNVEYEQRYINSSIIKIDELKITLDGKNYAYPFTLKDLFDNGWELKDVSEEELLEEEMYPDEDMSFDLKLKNNSGEMNVYIYNDSSKEILPSKCKVAALSIVQDDEKSNSNFEFLGVKPGDGKDIVEKTIGETREVYNDEYTYTVKLKSGEKFTLKLEFSSENNKLNKLVLKPAESYY